MDGVGAPGAEGSGGEPGGGAATRIRLDLAYAGGGFAGWAAQPVQRTVQGELDAALAVLFRRAGPSPRLTVAGRTDAGVHAIGQVAHLDFTPEQFSQLRRPPRRSDPGAEAHPDPAAALAKRLNGILGSEREVHIRRARIAPEGFDARFSAVWRRYEYRIADPVALHDPRMRGFTLWHPFSLDQTLMQRAAEELLGLHDWAAYCRPRLEATTIRELQQFAWARDRDGVLVATVQADAFCHSMVRALVGGSIAVGQGRLPGERMRGIRDEAQRTSEFAVAPARGLTLAEVGYPPDAELAARAAQTRARRDGDAVP